MREKLIYILTRLYLSLCLLVILCSQAQTIEMIKGKDGVEMVLIPSGSFYMGSSGTDYPLDEQPKHKVYLDAYYIDRYEISNANFVKFLNSIKPDEGINKTRWQWVVIRNDLETDQRTEWFPTEIIYINGHYEVLKGFENYPVISVSWFAADAYCKWAGERLPTEAEWERAARGGLKGRDFPWGNQLPTLDSGIAFNKRWVDNSLPAPTVPVNTYPYNKFGIYGMAGNAAEWILDWYSPVYYQSSPRKNPMGPSSGTRKVVRGGSWASPMMGIRVAVRYSYPPSALPAMVGFRCVLPVKD